MSSTHQTGKTPRVVDAPRAVEPRPSDEPVSAPTRRLAIEWSTVVLDSDADALALWDRIAPTGDDWNQKLDEIPPAVGRKLALAILRGSAASLTCMTPPAAGDCAPRLFDVDAPKPTASHQDPCLRRLLALWSIEQLEPDDVPGLLPAWRTLVAIPPPESELTAAILDTIPDTSGATLLELLALAWQAGHHDLVNGKVGRLDEPLLKLAVTRHHIDGALEILSAEGHRAVYLAAIADEQLGANARRQAIVEVVSAHDAIPADVRGPLVKAAGSKDCSVAAMAARAFARRNEPRFVPRRPAAATPARMMRALCVLASYEPLQEADETSPLASFLPPKGLERVNVSHDPLGDVDTDGDGDPKTTRAVDLIPRSQASLPEVEDLARAMKRCTGTVCTSDDHVFQFTLKPVGGALALTRLDVVERPRCHRQTP